MRKNVVVCLNLQVNYFGTKGTSYLGEQAKVVKTRIIEELRRLPKEEFEVIHVRNVRSPEDTFYSHEATQNVVGTLDIQMVEGLPPCSSILVSATRPSAVWRTPLLTEIKKLEPGCVYLVGAETNSAVLFTAADLRYLGYNVRVPEPLVVARDSYVHSFAVSQMADVLGVHIEGMIV